MTGKVMRSLTSGAMPFTLFIVALLLLGPLLTTAVAQAGITLGVAVDGSGPVPSSEEGQELSRILESQLSIPVKIRSFATEDQLYLWLTRFREVDVAWFSEDFLDEMSAVQFSLLVRHLEHTSGSLSGAVVARQGMNDILRQQIRSAFLTIHESHAGRTLLVKLGASSFVTPGFRQTTPALPELSSPADAPVIVSDTDTDQGPVSPEPQMTQQEEHAPAQHLDVAEELPELSAGKESGVPSPTDPSPKADQKKQVSLVADYLAYNAEEDSYEAKGDVILRQAGVELKSDELLWQSSTQDVAAQGSVFLNDAEAEISGERLQYNMATGQGQIRDGLVFVREGNFHLIGEQIEKHSATEYFVKQGSFTTCDGEIPDWKFSASEVNVTLGGYARAKNVWFHVNDVPVLYTPYLSFPVRTERESGVLTPSFGYSNNKGTRASLAWYQVIDRNMDATISLDYLSETGLGKGLEYRYALAKQNNGKALYYHVTGLGETPNPKRPEEDKDIPDLYYLKWEHRGKLPGHWRLMADIEYTEDKLFFEEFGETAEEYSQDKTVSSLMLMRNWQKLNLVGYARYTKDLETNNDRTLQRLPEVGLSQARYRLGDTSFYAGLESYATSFWRDKGEDGERLFLKPSLAAVFKPGSWLEIIPEVALYERIYNTNSGDDEKFVPELSLSLATRLVKSFDVNHWGMDRIQHSVEPKATYTYVPDESQDDLPLFDLSDRIERQNDIAYALVNRLVARSKAADGSSAYREILNLRLSQSYDIDEERNNRSGEDQPFSDVRVELALRPTPNISLVLDSRIPVYADARFRTLSVGASIRDDRGNALRVDYSYKDVDFFGLATDYVKVKVDTPILKPVYVSLEERYDFRDNRALEKVVGLEYRSKCWSIFMTYRNRYREFEKDDKEIMISFVLSGLGMGQGFGGGF